MKQAYNVFKSLGYPVPTGLGLQSLLVIGVPTQRCEFHLFHQLQEDSHKHRQYENIFGPDTFGRNDLLTKILSNDGQQLRNACWLVGRTAHGIVDVIDGFDRRYADVM